MKIHGDRDDLNVWPAVTDTILLMASIFIVLSVISLLNVVQQLDDRPGEGDGAKGERIEVAWCRFKNNTLQFHKENQGKDGALFVDRVTARQRLKQVVLPWLAKYYPGVVNNARAHKDWNGEYYVILEVAGHTDADVYHVDGGDGNWLLSARRAVTVYHELEGLLGPQERERYRIRTGEKDGRMLAARPGDTIFRLAGYSSHVPVHPRDDDSNRRVEIRLYAQQASQVREKR